MPLTQASTTDRPGTGVQCVQHSWAAYLRTAARDRVRAHLYEAYGDGEGVDEEGQAVDPQIPEGAVAHLQTGPQVSLAILAIIPVHI